MNIILNLGIANQLASATGLKSIIPRHTATIYPETIPTKNGIILKNPLALVITIAVTINDTNATKITFHSKCVPSARPI